MIRIVFVSLLAVLTIFALSTSSAGKNLTPYHEQDPVLARLASVLDGVKVDVRSNYSGVALASTRAVLAPLGEMRRQPRPEIWPELERDFKRGALGFMTAIERPKAAEAGTHAPKTANSNGSKLKPRDARWMKQLRETWDAAEPSRRVFLSFTRADFAKANDIRKVFAKDGFTVFTYLSDGGPPPFAVEEVGKFFREAGERFVLDTPEARKSAGVWIEREIQEHYQHIEKLDAELDRLRKDRERLVTWLDERRTLDVGFGSSVKIKEQVALSMPQYQEALKVSEPFASSLLLRARALKEILEANPQLSGSNSELVNELERWMNPNAATANPQAGPTAARPSAASPPPSVEQVEMMRVAFDGDWKKFKKSQKSAEPPSPPESCKCEDVFAPHVTSAMDLVDQWVREKAAARSLEASDPAKIVIDSQKKPPDTKVHGIDTEPSVHEAPKK